MNVRLHIDRLVLEGVPISSAQGPILQAAIESKLVQLFAARGLSLDMLQGIALPSLRVSGAPIQTNSNPVQMGHQIAGALMSGLGSNSKSSTTNNTKGT